MKNFKMRKFFLDTEGKEYFNEQLDNHEELAEWIVENDEQLKEEFKKSRMKMPIAFLIKEGWTYGTSSEIYKEVVFWARKISEHGRKIIEYYHEEGYKPYDIERMYGEKSLREFFGKIDDENKQEIVSRKEIGR